MVGVARSPPRIVQIAAYAHPILAGAVRPFTLPAPGEVDVLAFHANPIAVSRHHLQTSCMTVAKAVSAMEKESFVASLAVVTDPRPVPD